MPTVGGKVFKFGYNFAFDLVRQIWEHALSLHENDLLPSYVNLLWNHPHLGDVDQAERLLEPSTKTRIWEHIMCASRDKLFFYSAGTSVQSVDVIRARAGKKPTKLPKTFWQLLRSASPIRTIEEEQQQRCKDATIRALPDTALAKSIDRAFRACLALLKAPSEMKVVYVEDMAGRLDVFITLQNGP
ncbi:hypothetical protein N7451_012149 [Penicillium sp. IBT 35674x]|nr:hypothetical protein N7451_012149 [Penicillium sp. IBT 35674x]